MLKSAPLTFQREEFLTDTRGGDSSAQAFQFRFEVDDIAGTVQATLSHTASVRAGQGDFLSRGPHCDEDRR